MNKVSAYYESVGDRMTGSKAERAYDKAQADLEVYKSGYMVAFKRLQSKIIKAIESQIVDDPYSHYGETVVDEVNFRRG